jgi:hypothetical protein
MNATTEAMARKNFRLLIRPTSDEGTQPRLNVWSALDSRSILRLPMGFARLPCTVLIRPHLCGLMCLQGHSTRSMKPDKQFERVAGIWTAAVQMRKWILFVFVIGAALRYLLPGRFALDFRSGGVVRGVPINLVAFWLVLAIGGIVILVKLIAARTQVRATNVSSLSVRLRGRLH